MLDGQLYTVLGAAGRQGRWQLRLWWKPFVTLIWLGGALIALGGALSLIGRVRRERRAGEEALRMRRWLIWAPLAVFALLLALVAQRPAPARRSHGALGDGRQAAARLRAAAAAARQARASRRRVRQGQAAPAQRLRQLVRALHRRGAAAAARSSAWACRSTRIAIRDTPGAVRGFLDAQRRSLCRASATTGRAQVQLALGSSGVPETLRDRRARPHRDRSISATSARTTCPKRSPRQVRSAAR